MSEQESFSKSPDLQSSLSNAVCDRSASEVLSSDSHTGRPFDMNGFQGDEEESRVKVEPVGPVPRASVLSVARQSENDYEAVKAGHESEQDFAVVNQKDLVPDQPRDQTPDGVVQIAREAVPTPLPVVGGNASAGIEQLELRAIFGVSQTLTADEIIQRACDLAGIHNVSLVGENESRALSNFQLALQEMGLGSVHDMKLSSASGAVDFLTEGETTIAILHEGAYFPGVQETLIIVARELGKFG